MIHLDVLVWSIIREVANLNLDNVTFRGLKIKEIFKQFLTQAVLTLLRG